MENFDVTIEPTDGAVLLRVNGELDIGTAPVFQQAVGKVLDSSPRRAVVDLRGCSFIDSSGSRAIGAAGRAFQDGGLELAVLCPPANRVVRNVLDLLGLDQVVPVVDDLPGTTPGDGG